MTQTPAHRSSKRRSLSKLCGPDTINLISFGESDNIATITTKTSTSDVLPVEYPNDCLDLQSWSSTHVVGSKPLLEVIHRDIESVKVDCHVFNECQKSSSTSNNKLCEANVFDLHICGVKFSTLVDTGGSLSLVDISLLKHWDQNLTGSY